MFGKETKSFGEFQQIVISHQVWSSSFSVIPSFGANLTGLSLDLDDRKIDLIDAVKTASELKADPKFKSALLSPWPNRIRDGIYLFQGEHYQLAVNEIPRNHAIHGLVYNRPFEIESEKFTNDVAFLSLKYNYPGDNPGYPFPFTQWIEFWLGKNYLNVKIKVLNTHSGPIPVGFGWHPYFDFEVPVDELTVQLPNVREILVDDRMIPTGEMKSFQDYAKPQPIGERFLDSCFKLENPSPKVSTRIGCPARKMELEIWQETGPDKYNYVQVFTPKTRDSIAVEPMTCAINAFNNLEGLNLLDSDQSLEASFGLTLNAI